MWPVMMATSASVNPPTKGMRWPKNERMPATRLTTAMVLLGGAIESAPPGPTAGTVVEGAGSWPAIWVAGWLGGSWPDGVLTGASLTLIQWLFRRKKLSRGGF